VSWPVVVTTPDWTLDAKVRNISLGGALIQCIELPDMTVPLSLEIKIPEHGYTIVITAKVVHFDVDEGDGSSLSYRFGISFDNLSSKDRVLLNNAILALSAKKPKQ
jgi:hypothetical protein